MLLIYLTHMSPLTLCNVSMWFGWRVVVIVSYKFAARCLMRCCSRCGIIITCLYMVPSVSLTRRTRWSLSNFVYCTRLCSLNAIGIAYLMSMPLVFNLTFTMEGGGERGHCCSIASCIVGYLLVSCTLLYTYCTVYTPSILLCVSLDCSADGVSPPSGAIRNWMANFVGSCGYLYLVLLFYTTLVQSSILLLLRFYSTSKVA